MRFSVLILLFSFLISCQKKQEEKPSGRVTALNCGNSTITGSLTSGNPANNVSILLTYDGGNGGSYFDQSIKSTNVNGLIATIKSGNFANGSGSINIEITGTPATAGNAFFSIVIGGQSCNLTLNIVAPIGTVSTLNCTNANLNGTLTAGVAATNVTVVVPYTGGNAGTYTTQTVNSSGVTGLSAVLSSGTFANGTGSLSFAIVGTPSTSGNATFSITLGGKNCNVVVDVAAPLGNITTLNCDNATSTGILISGTPANNVKVNVPYSGGNGGTHNSQIFNSTGVLGLTASLSAGNLSNGSGTLIFSITGTPSTSGTANFSIILGGQSCMIKLTVFNVQPQYPAGSVFCSSGATLVVEVTSPTTGRVWMDRNLGASQKATSSTDVNSYGDYYQWGRGNDGHQCKSSQTINTQSNTDQPNHGFFIVATTGNNDWRNPENRNLWQGTSGINNPCPIGFRLPTSAEFISESLSWSSVSPAGAFASQLKLPLPGWRNYSTGNIGNTAEIGWYWTSTITSGWSRYFGLTSAGGADSYYFRASGMSIRCIKN